MKINDKRANEAQRSADESKDAEKSRGAEPKRSFKELLRKDGQATKKQSDRSEKSQKPEGALTREGITDEGRLAPGGMARKDGMPRKDGMADKNMPEGGLARGDVAQKEVGEFQRPKARGEGEKSGFTGAKSDQKFEELSPEDERALMKGSVPGIAPSPESDLAPVKSAQPLAPSQSKHEVTEKLLATIVNDGYVTEDVKGRKVVMMQVDIPGRGTVNMRLWRRSSGVELRMRADDPKLASEIRRNRGQLESGARDRGIHFSSIEVVG